MGTGSTLSLIQHKLSSARSITVLTGAGISADSGVPTFRGADGLWRTFARRTWRHQKPLHVIPGSCGSGITGGANSLPTKRPNPAHDAVAQMERQFEQFWLITQNVDGLHRDAGSRKLSEIHGNIWMVRCTQCRRRDRKSRRADRIPPLCSTCGGLLRPHIVWFGESLAEEDLQRSYTALKSSDLCLIIGTSGLVYPAAGFASIAKEARRLRRGDQSRSHAAHRLVDVRFRAAQKTLSPSYWRRERSGRRSSKTGDRESIRRTCRSRTRQQHSCQADALRALHVVPLTVADMQGICRIDRMFVQGLLKDARGGFGGMGQTQMATVSKRSAIPSPRKTENNRESKLEMMPSSNPCAFNVASTSRVSGKSRQESGRSNTAKTSSKNSSKPPNIPTR